MILNKWNQNILGVLSANIPISKTSIVTSLIEKCHSYVVKQVKFYSIPSKWVNNKSFFTKRIAPNSILCGTWSDYKKPSLQHTWVGLPCQLTNESAIWNAFAINSKSNVENIFIISNSTCHLPNSHLCKFFYKPPVCTKLIFLSKFIYFC